jgi:hypothetical protein
MSVSFELTDDQRELRDLAHDFAEGRAAADRGRVRRALGFSGRPLGRAARAGLTSYAIPRSTAAGA